MPKLVDPSNPKREYETPIQRFECPLGKDAERKRGFAARIQNYRLFEEPRYSCPAPSRNSRISLFSARVQESDCAKNGLRAVHRSLVLSEEGGLNIFLERCAHSAKLYLAEESGVREIRLDGNFLLRLPPSLAAQMIEMDPMDLDVYLVGRGTEIVRQASMRDIRDYALESTALFMLGEWGLFAPGEFKSATIHWASV